MLESSDHVFNLAALADGGGEPEANRERSAKLSTKLRFEQLLQMENNRAKVSKAIAAFVPSDGRKAADFRAGTRGTHRGSRATSRR